MDRPRLSKLLNYFLSTDIAPEKLGVFSRPSCKGGLAQKNRRHIGTLGAKKEQQTNLSPLQTLAANDLVRHLRAANVRAYGHETD